MLKIFLVTKEMQTKPQWDAHVSMLEWLKSETDSVRCWHGWGATESPTVL